MFDMRQCFINEFRRRPGRIERQPWLERGLDRSGMAHEIERLTRSTGEHEIVDDGKRTTIMEAIDPAALGLDFGSGNSGTFSAVGDEDSGPTSTNGDDKKPGGAKKKRKRR